MKTKAILMMVFGFLAFGFGLVQAAPDLPPVLLSPARGHTIESASSGSTSLYAESGAIYPLISLSDEDKIEIVEQKREQDIESSHNENLHEPSNLSQLPSATSGSCTIVSTIQGPGSDTEGLAWDGGNLWVSESNFSTNNAGMILMIDLNGNVLSSFNAPYQNSIGPRPKGLVYDGTYLWSVDFLDNKIYKLTKSGDVVGSIPAPADIPSGLHIPSGLAWDGNSLWVSEWYSYKIYKIDPVSGQILKSFNAPDYGNEFPSGVPYGLAWDGTYLWASNYNGIYNGIYKIDPNTGSILETCDNSEFIGAYGLTWDGQYLWAGSWIDRRIMKISVSGNACTYSISPTSQSFGSTGGTDSVSVTAPNGCSWTATSNASWITITSEASGTGNGVVDYSVSANTNTSSRTGTCTITGQILTVTQAGTNPNPAGPPKISVSPTSVNFGNVNLGGTSEKTVTIQNKGKSDLVISSINISGANASDFTETNNCTTIPTGGSCTITVTFAPTSKGKRTGTIGISSSDPKKPTINVKLSGNGKSSPCTYSISPSSQQFDASGGTGSVNVTVPNGCSWTATSNASWITITSNSSWSGNGSVNYTVAANTKTSQRTATMTIAGKTFTVTQSPPQIVSSLIVGTWKDIQDTYRSIPWDTVTLSSDGKIEGTEVPLEPGMVRIYDGTYTFDNTYITFYFTSGKFCYLGTCTTSAAFESDTLKVQISGNTMIWTSSPGITETFTRQ